MKTCINFTLYLIYLTIDNHYIYSDRRFRRRKTKEAFATRTTKKKKKQKKRKEKKKKIKKKKKKIRDGIWLLLS